MYPYAAACILLGIGLVPTLAAATPASYDYVIVGGGVTGLVVANRLTEDKNGTFWTVRFSEESHY